MRQFCIIGAGKVGTAITVNLIQNGYKFLGVSDSHKQKAQDLIASIGTGTRFDTIAEMQFADIVWLTVNDDSIPVVVSEIINTEKDLKEKTFIHTSGFLPVSILNPLELNRAKILGIHPLTSVSEASKGSCSFKDVPMAVEGEDALIIEGYKIVTDIMGIPFRIFAHQRTAYHTAAVIFSNLLLGLIHAGETILSVSDIKPESSSAILWEHLVRDTLSHALQTNSLQALTGPLIRGDYNTLLGHKNILTAQFPEIWAMYRSICAFLLKSLTSQSNGNSDRLRSLEALFSE